LLGSWQNQVFCNRIPRHHWRFSCLLKKNAILFLPLGWANWHLMFLLTLCGVHTRPCITRPIMTGSAVPRQGYKGQGSGVVYYPGGRRGVEEGSETWSRSLIIIIIILSTFHHRLSSISQFNFKSSWEKRAEQTRLFWKFIQYRTVAWEFAIFAYHLDSFCSFCFFFSIYFTLFAGIIILQHLV